MPDQTPLTPEGVRALIAEAEEYAGRDEYPGAMLIRDLAAALSASLPREDADLDAIEADLNDPAAAAYIQRLAQDEAEKPGALSALGRAQTALPALLARVRLAEAERDEAIRKIGGQ